MCEVSIIVPVYNTKAYLKDCVESILSQSYNDFELILINDGSTDGSDVVCDDFKMKDSRVIVLHKENGGVSSARNVGIEKASGNWICFVDSDDELLPNGLKTMVDGISDAVDLVMADYIKSDHGIEALSSNENRSIINRKKALGYMFNNTGLKYQGYSVCKLFRSNIIKQHQLSFDTDITIKEDTAFVVKYLCTCRLDVMYYPCPVYLYKVDSTSSTMGALNTSYNPNYISSFDAIIRMCHYIQSAFPNNKDLRFLVHEELLNRTYWILGHMLIHNAVDKEKISQLKQKARQEVGVVHYLDYQFRRNKRRTKRLMNRIFKTNFHVQ